MLSEPFHRLIVKDEEELIDLSNMPRSSSQVNSADMNAVPEEEDELSSWW